MCGICGICLPQLDAPVNEQTLRKMTELLHHRGPDSDGYEIQPSVGLGVRRLRIVDLETGDQPITNEDGKIALICNGEIYNAPELRHELVAAGHRFRTRSDIEVIIHLYEECGPTCLDSLRGMFAFALWDSSKKSLMLARDRIGIKPLHYSIRPDKSLYFASESKSILIADDDTRSLDPAALHDCFSVGFVTGHKTFFKAIRRLLPGHYLLYSRGDCVIRQYWDVQFPAGPEGFSNLTRDEWCKGLLEKLQESVKIHLRSDVEVGCLLSAGLDSSVIAALASRAAPGPRHAFSLGFEHTDYDEIHSNSILSDYPDYQLKSHRMECKDSHFGRLPRELWYHEDPGPAGNWITTGVLTNEASGYVKAVLCGEGADEIFGGYRWFHLYRLLQPFQKIPIPVSRLLLPEFLLRRFAPWAGSLHRALGPLDLRRYAYLIGSGAPHMIHQLLSENFKESLASSDLTPHRLPCPDEFETWPPFLKLQYYEMKTRLPDYIVRRLDGASMSHSLEVRVPFLDHVLVEYCAKIPPSLKMSLFLKEKALLRRACRGVLPPEIVTRRKRGLQAPVNHWFRQPLPSFAQELLSIEQLRAKGYFNPVCVNELIRFHRARQGEYGHELLRILLTQIWDEIFICGRDVASF